MILANMHHVRAVFFCLTLALTLVVTCVAGTSHAAPQAMASVEKPFVIDSKKQALLTRVYKMGKDGRWKDAMSLARSDRDVTMFAELMRVAQTSSGKYDTSKLNDFLKIKQSSSTPNTAPNNKMSPIAMSPDKIISSYNNIKDKEQAAKRIRNLWRNRTLTLAEENKFYGRFKSLLTIDDNNKRTENLLWANQTDAAKRMLPRIGGQPKKVLAARIAIKTAPNYQAVKKIIASMHSDEKNPDVIYEKILWMHNTRNLYKEVVSALLKNPTPTHHIQNWWIISRYYIRDFLVKGSTNAMHKTAYILASRYKPAIGPDAADAEWTAGWIALRFLNNPQLAYNHFSKLYNGSNSVQTASRAAYWSGMASKTMKDGRYHQWFEVAASYTTTFYGQLALSMLGKTDHLPLPKHVISEKTIANLQSNKLAKALYYACVLHDQTLASALMQISINSTKNPDELSAITAMPTAFYMPHVSLIGAKQAAAQRKMILVDSLYPTHYVNHSSRAVDTPLRMAIMRQESAFDRTAVSSAGARGVMQIMPETGRAVANRLNIGFSENKLFDPNYNITIGSHYLRSALESTDKSLVLSLVIYNAGPDNLTRFIADYGDPRLMRNVHDVVDWIELIPFHETRNYVQRIVESLQVYRSLLGNSKYPARLEITNDLQNKYRVR